MTESLYFKVLMRSIRGDAVANAFGEDVHDLKVGDKFEDGGCIYKITEVVAFHNLANGKAAQLKIQRIV